MTPCRKHSKKRDALLEVIRSTKDHPGAQWVYDRLKPEIPGLSLGTVYRNIKVLREAGELISVGEVNGEERFDGRTAPHLHAVCKKCGAIKDLPDTELPEAFTISLPGFILDMQSTVFYGTCALCSAK